MDTLTALHTRVSFPRLSEPAPNEDQLEAIFQAALRAPDHAMLRPWRFLTIAGEQRSQLGQLLVAAAKQANPQITDAEQNKLLQAPLRAPLLVAVICSPKFHAKVPELEQLLSTAAAVQNMLLAAYALGVGAMWRTGLISYHEHVQQGLGLSNTEKLLGFIYMGQPIGQPKSIMPLDTKDYFQPWQG
ncbi:nitroreductase [Zooshikella marina]|uniref:nitroreductase family protein n=1 Tax=Zooshikella ganghwensis TaxID=202772 RepID=UPI001BAE5B0F|nr:nitroreductase [Zooshikella ganghwensis]MBU2704462.1 nitroreductase [Zooshikella ganghwensis]